MKQFILVLLLAVLFTSCGDTSEEMKQTAQLAAVKKVMVQQLVVTSLGDYELKPGQPMQVAHVDTMYHIGDTMSMDSKILVIRRD